MYPGHSGLEKVDLNGDGKVQYIMIEGDPENVDAKSWMVMFSFAKPKLIR